MPESVRPGMVLAEAQRRTTPSSGRRWLDRPGFELHMVALLWLVPVALTLASAPAASIVLATTAAAAICLWAIFVRPRTSLTALPFFALLSPMTGLMDLGGLRLVYADLIFVPLLALAGSILVLQSAGRGPRQPTALHVLALLYLLSLLIGLAAGFLISGKPFLYLIQFAIIALLTSTLGASPNGWRDLRRAWFVATCLGALILLHAYSEGRNLVNLKDADETSAAEDLLALFRANYYYAGFHFTLGLCVVMGALRLFFPMPTWQRLLLAAALALLTLALLATVNKTALAAALAALVISVGVLALRFRRDMARSVFWLSLIAAAGAAGWNFASVDETSQIEMAVDRLASPGSLLIRFEVFEQALRVWASSPVTVLVGYGPDFLDNSGDPQLADVLKTSATTGYVEGTVDSAWLSYMIELGLPSLLLLLGVFAAGLAKAYRGLRACPTMDEAAYDQLSLLAGLAFLVFAMTTQMLGYSKTSWLPLQIVLLAAMGLGAGKVRRS